MTNIRPRRGSYRQRLAAEGYVDPSGRFAVTIDDIIATDTTAVEGDSGGSF